MSSEHLTVNPTPQLNFYFNGIRIEFDRLNKELDEARKQRDEYKTNYMNREKEFRDFITTLLQRLDDKDKTCQHCRGDITYAAGLTDDNASISPSSPSSECYLPLEEEGSVTDRPDNTEISMEITPVEEERNHDDDVRRAISDEVLTIPGITAPPLRSGTISTNEVGKPGWDIMYNGEMEIAWKLDLVLESTQRRGNLIAFNPDGSYLAVACGDVVCLFDVDTGERISVMRGLYKNPGKRVSSNTCLDFSPDKKYLATGNTSGKVSIWSISQKRVRNIFRHGEFINYLHFSPNGQHLVTVADETVRIWRLRDGSSIVLTGGEYPPWVVQFSPDGRYVASAYDEQIVIWNVRTRRLVARWEGHGDLVSSLVFTPDGKGLLTGSFDRAVVCWDIGWLSSSGDNPEGTQDVDSTVRELSRFIGHTDFIYQVSISPDGKWVASRSYDRTIRIWNTRDATLQCTLRGPGEVRSIAFSPVGTYFAIADEFRQVKVCHYACRGSEA